MMERISLGAAFAGGVLSFLSPCVLPLIPGYICFLSGLTLKELQDGIQRGKIIKKAGLLKPVPPAGWNFWVADFVYFASILATPFVPPAGWNKMELKIISILGTQTSMIFRLIFFGVYAKLSTTIR